MELKRRLYSWLNHNHSRFVLEHAASMITSLRYSARCRVSFRDGFWLHDFPDGSLVERELHIATIPTLDALTRDYWFHQYTPRPGDVVLDVGAGTGWESRLCAHLVGSAGRVIAIEAHPDTYACLVRSIERNRLTNVTPILCAVSDTTGEILISSQENHQGNTTVHQSRTGVCVPARRLDDLCDELGIDHIDLLKMNIEGAEKVALPSLGRLSARTHHLAVSCHDFKADWGQGEEFRSKAVVTEWLIRENFAIATRPSDGREWVRDYVYGLRQARHGSPDAPATP